jgi:hypothetical protein
MLSLFVCPIAWSSMAETKIDQSAIKGLYFLNFVSASFVGLP